MQLNVKSNIKEFMAELSVAERMVAKDAIPGFLNDLAFDAKTRQEDTMRAYMDRPTPFTQKSLFVKKAGAMKLTASVIVKRIQAEYLDWLIDGGVRPPKNKANVTPTAKTTNAYGNIPNKKVKTMLSNKTKFFSGIPKGMKGEKNAGIWERYGRATKTGGQKIRKVVNYIGAASYSAGKYPFYSIGERVVFMSKDSRWNRNFKRAMERAGFKIV